MEPNERTPATTWRNHLRTILVPTDFSTCAEKAFPLALDLAREVGAEVHLLHVIQPLEGDAYSPLKYTPEANVLHDSPDKLIYDRMAAMVAAHDTEGVRVEIVKQRGTWIARKILDYATREEMGLIVIGTHGGSGMKQFFLGSVAKEIVHRAPCDVLIVHEQVEGTPTFADVRRILVPMDFSASSEGALHRAKKLAATYGAQIDLLHVVESPSFLIPVTGLATIGDLVPNVCGKAEECLEHLFNKVDGPAVPFEIHVLEGQPASRIIEFAKEHDVGLIVIGTRGFSGLKYFLLGSVTERVVRAAPCLVYTVETGAATPANAANHAALEADQ